MLSPITYPLSLHLRGENIIKLSMKDHNRSIDRHLCSVMMFCDHTDLGNVVIHNQMVNRAGIIQTDLPILSHKQMVGRAGLPTDRPVIRHDQTVGRADIPHDLSLIRHDQMVGRAGIQIDLSLIRHNQMVDRAGIQTDLSMIRHDQTVGRVGIQIDLHDLGGTGAHTPHQALFPCNSNKGSIIEKIIIHN